MTDESKDANNVESTSEFIDECQDESNTPVRIILSQESFDGLAEMLIATPNPPTEALVDLFK